MSAAKTLAAMAAVLAFCAISATPAFAEEEEGKTKMAWFVGGKELTKGENVAVASPGSLDSPAVFNSPGLSLKISCSSYSTAKAELVGGEEEKALVESAKFEGCSESSPATCTLTSSTIATVPLALLLELRHIHNGKLPHFLKLAHPQTGTTIAKLTFTGGSCPLAGEKPLSGSFKEGVPNLESEEITHITEASGTEENNSLELGGQKVYIEGGKTLIKLSSGSKWSFKAI
jgi:hypothetical protein